MLNKVRLRSEVKGLSVGRLTQRGINMVDLMMWLVIAALLLAAAIQGIGYYQKAAYLYQVKNDVMGGATKVISLSGIEHNGKISESVVDEGLDITQKTRGVVLAADTDPNGKPMIRGTHPGIPDKEVIYLFSPYGAFKDSTLYIIDPSEVPSGWVGDDDHDGIPNGSDPDPDGDGVDNVVAPDTDNDGIPDASDPDIDNNGVPNTAWEEYSVVSASQATGATVSRTGSDGGTTTWNYNDTNTYGHSHDPVSPNLLTSPQLDIIQLKAGADGVGMGVTVRTDGTVPNAVGGSFNVYFHADYECINNSTNVVERFASVKADGSLDAPYLGGPPPPSQTTMWWNCSPSERIDNFVLRPISAAEFTASGSRVYNYTKDQVVHWKRAS